eukprot:2572046-Rhodomonas_salina.1
MAVLQLQQSAPSWGLDAAHSELERGWSAVGSHARGPCCCPLRPHAASGTDTELEADFRLCRGAEEGAERGARSSRARGSAEIKPELQGRDGAERGDGELSRAALRAMAWACSERAEF